MLVQNTVDYKTQNLRNERKNLQTFLGTVISGCLLDDGLAPWLLDVGVACCALPAKRDLLELPPSGVAAAVGAWIRVDGKMT